MYKQFIYSFLFLLGADLALATPLHPAAPAQAQAAPASSGSRHVRRVSAHAFCPACNTAEGILFPVRGACLSPSCQFQIVPSRVVLFNSYKRAEQSKADVFIRMATLINEELSFPYNSTISQNVHSLFENPAYVGYLQNFIAQTMKEDVSLTDDNMRRTWYLRSLMFDPAHGKIEVASIKEALAGLEAIRRGFIPGPLMRGGRNIEFYDGCGNPWDVKSIVDSPNFDAYQLAIAIQKQLSITDPASERPVSVILDSTFASILQHIEIWRQLHKILSAEQLGRIIEVVVKLPGATPYIYDTDTEETSYASNLIEPADTAGAYAKQWLAQATARNLQYIAHLEVPSDLLESVLARAISKRLEMPFTLGIDEIPFYLEAELMSGLEDFTQAAILQTRRGALVDGKAVTKFIDNASPAKRGPLMGICRELLGRKITRSLSLPITVQCIFDRSLHLRQRSEMAIHKLTLFIRLLSPEYHQTITVLLAPLAAHRCSDKNLATSPTSPTTHREVLRILDDRTLATLPPSSPTFSGRRQLLPAAPNKKELRRLRTGDENDGAASAANAQ